MDDWKTRLVEEYKQLKERTEKLSKELCKLEVERRLDSNYPEANSREKYERRKGEIRFEFMSQQLIAMREYLHSLELRADLEGIEL